MEDVIFWDLGGYKRVLDELRRGQRSCELFVKMVQERAEIEERYSRSLDSWRERWTVYSVNGREVGGTVTSWNNCLLEATLVAEIHRECRNRIISTGGPAENMTDWIQENFRQKNGNGLDTVQRLESDFLVASGEFTKAYEKTLRVREAYHKLSDDAQKARRFADEESQDKFVNKSTKTRLFNRADKLTIQENYVRRIYKRRVDTCQGEVKDRYKKFFLHEVMSRFRLTIRIRGMQEVLNRCQVIESARLQCIKNQMLTFITMLDMSGASKRLLDCSRLAYYDVTKTIPEQDMQTWLLRFNINNFIELPSFEEYTSEHEDYEPIEQEAKKRPSGSFFELSLFGSSSEEDSSESDSESSSSSSSSSSESESSVPTIVSSLSNVSRKHKKYAKNRKSENLPQRQQVISHQTKSHHRQHSNNHTGYTNNYAHAHQTSDQLVLFTESSVQSSQLSDSIQYQSRTTDSHNIDDKLASCIGDLSKQSREQSTCAHTSQSTGFSIDNNPITVEDNARIATAVTTNDQVSHTDTLYDVSFHSANAQSVKDVDSSSFQGKIVSEEGQTSATNSTSRDDPSAASDTSMKVEVSKLYSSDSKSVRESNAKIPYKQSQKGKESQTCYHGEFESELQNEDLPQMKCSGQFQASLYKNAKWSSVVSPVRGDTSEQNSVYKREIVKCRKQTDQEFVENIQKGEEHTQNVMTKIAIDEHNLHSPEHERNCHTQRDDYLRIPPFGVHYEDQSRLGRSSCCEVGSDHESGFGVHQTRKAPDRCLARWFVERYPEYEQLEERMWGYLQRCNPVRYHAALTDAKKLMLFVDTQSSSGSTKVGNVHLCNSFHICRRQYDSFRCQCLDQNQVPVTDGHDKDGYPSEELFNNPKITEAEDKFCQEATDKILRLRHFMEQNNENINRNECQMRHNSDHMCDIATGFMAGNNHEEVTHQDSIGCNFAKQSRDVGKSKSQENETEDFHEVDWSNEQSRLKDEGSQKNQPPTDISDESDFSTDDDFTEDNIKQERSNNQPNLQFHDRRRADRHARLTLKPTQGEFLVRSLYNFSPANWDELKLRSGEYFIQIGRNSDNGWAMGRTRTKQGLFPASYVTFVKS